MQKSTFGLKARFRLAASLTYRLAAGMLAPHLTKENQSRVKEISRSAQSVLAPPLALSWKGRLSEREFFRCLGYVSCMLNAFESAHWSGVLPVMPEGNVVLANQIETLEDPMPPTELSSGELRSAVERWAAQQLDKPTLAEALRRLVEDGLATD